MMYHYHPANQLSFLMQNRHTHPPAGRVLYHHSNITRGGRDNRREGRNSKLLCHYPFHHRPTSLPDTDVFQLRIKTRGGVCVVLLYSTIHNKNTSLTQDTRHTRYPPHNFNCVATNALNFLPIFLIRGNHLLFANIGRLEAKYHAKDLSYSQQA